MVTTCIQVSRVSSSCPLPLREALQDQQVGHNQASFKLQISPWVSEHRRFWGHFLRVKSTSYSPVALLKLSPTGVQSQTLLGAHLPSAQPGSPLRSLIHSLLGRSSTAIIILPFVSCLPWGYEYWRYHISTLLHIPLWFLFTVNLLC